MKESHIPEHAQRLAHDLLHGIGANDALVRQVGLVRQRIAVGHREQLVHTKDPHGERLQHHARLVGPRIVVHEDCAVAHLDVEVLGRSVLLAVEHHADDAGGDLLEADVLDAPLLAENAVELEDVLRGDGVGRVVGRILAVARNVVTKETKHVGSDE